MVGQSRVWDRASQFTSHCGIVAGLIDEQEILCGLAMERFVQLWVQRTIVLP